MSTSGGQFPRELSRLWGVGLSGFRASGSGKGVLARTPARGFSKGDEDD